MTRLRAAVVVTGSELVRGQRSDLNGPFLARELISLGFDVGRITLVDDRPGQLAEVLREAVQADLCVVSGGLGPTHDDRTVELLASTLGLPLVVDAELEREIEQVSRAVAARLGRPDADFRSGVRKQATLPAGALSLGLAGTAPGVVVQTRNGVAVALPGPPTELQRLWRHALEAEPVERVLDGVRAPLRRALRLFGVSESSVAQALEAAGGEGDGVEVTICAHDLEIHVDLMAEPAAEKRMDKLSGKLGSALAPYVYSQDEQPVEEVVLALARARGLTLATAESCTGGLLGARLTSVAGASDVYRGGVVAYADDVKVGELAVPADLIRRHGAVSAEVAAAMAAGARERLGADVAVSVTGVAGPGGGTPEKPVGLVYLRAQAPGGADSAALKLPGDRDAVRRRATVSALHLVRRLLAQDRHTAA